MCVCNPPSSSEEKKFPCLHVSYLHITEVVASLTNNTHTHATRPALIFYFLFFSFPANFLTVLTRENHKLTISVCACSHWPIPPSRDFLDSIKYRSAILGATKRKTNKIKYILKDRQRSENRRKSGTHSLDLWNLAVHAASGMEN